MYMSNEQFRPDDEMRDAFFEIVERSYTKRRDDLQEGSSDELRRMFESMRDAEELLNDEPLPTDHEIAAILMGLCDEWNRLGYRDNTIFYVGGTVRFSTDPGEAAMELEDIAPEAVSSTMQRGIADEAGVVYTAAYTPLRIVGMSEELDDTDPRRPKYRILLEFGFAPADDEGEDPNDDTASIAWLTAHYADINFIVDRVETDEEDADEDDDYIEEFESRAFRTMPLADVLNNLRDSFRRLCVKYGVDPNAPYIDSYTLNKLSIGVESELCEASHMVEPGNIVRAHDGMIIAISEDGAETGPLEISADRNIYGTFDRAVVRRLPDEVFALIGETGDVPPLGVGIMLDDVLVVDDTGMPCDEVGGEHLNGKRVILILQDANTRLDKVIYQDDREP